MLVSLTHQGQLRAGPMSIAAVDDEGDVWFATGLEAAKSAATLPDGRIAVVMQSAKRFVSITGTAKLIVDKEAARALWNEAWRPRFPEGPDDDDLALLHVRATDAEYWDMEGLRGFVYLFDAVRHAVRAQRVADDSTNRHDYAVRHAQNDDTDYQPTLTGWLKSHLHVSSRRARAE